MLNLDFFSFSDPNVRFVTLGCMLLSACAAVVGCFAFLRKKALIGDAIAHAVLPGICLAFIWGGTKNPISLLIGALISGWISILIVDALNNTTKLKNDTSIALVLSTFFGFGVLLLTAIQHSGNGAQAGLEGYLFGKAASLTFYDIKLFSLLALILLIIIISLFKEFKLISFNPDYAASIGLPVKLLQFTLSTLTVLAVAIGIQSVGVVLMAALLITPAAAARFWTNSLSKMILIAAGLGAFSALIGAYASYVAPSMPTGPWVVVFLSILAVLSIWFAPKKGLLHKYKMQKSNKNKILIENTLKRFYHLGEKDNSFLKERSFTELNESLMLADKELNFSIKSLKKKRLVILKKEDIILTQEGLNEAKRIIRLHRLWEMYLNKKLKLEADHVHNDAEAIEHIITAEIEILLEKELDFPTEDPHNQKIPYTN